ncbi:helix-turn-helix domain-containing protein [Legionella brunensis]|uniref:AraC family transcriptional regulator n=1 Tax=Legionella brunensis TaxID=29422 RepID=A0A0W0S4X0_9GAMM|nr:AraC family transcriptional regulator [Legionella brunensis]KTC78021.1 AraC family transcriptional regulator [Legionella brunensis]
MSRFLSLRSYSSETCSHSHDFGQLVLPIKGSLELEIEGQGGIVDEITGACIGSNQTHCFASGQDNLFLVVDLLDTETTQLTRELSPFLHLPTEIKKYLAFAHGYLSNNHDLLTDHLLYQLLMKLMTSDVSLNDRCVILAKRWIDEHFVNPINIAQLAQYCHLSKSQLQRRFKQSTGLGLAEYWRMKKLAYAKILVSNINLSIEEIAHKVGYGNLPAFSRRFAQSFGMSPSQWRNMTLPAKNMRLTGNKILSDI